MGEKIDKDFDKSKMPGESTGADIDTPTADDDTQTTDQSGVSGTIVEDGQTTTKDT